MSGRGAPAWAMVKLRVVQGDVPDVADVLVLPTGRRYQVIGVYGRGLECLVLPPEADAGPGRVWDWRWARRKRPISRNEALKGR